MKKEVKKKKAIAGGGWGWGVKDGGNEGGGDGGMGVVGMALTIGFSVGLESERKKK